MRALDAEIENAERETDASFIACSTCPPDEIALLEASIAGRY